MRFGLVILATCHFQDTGQLGFYIFWHPLAYQGPSLSAAISARRWLVLLGGMHGARSRPRVARRKSAARGIHQESPSAPKGGVNGNPASNRGKLPVGRRLWRIRAGAVERVLTSWERT